jgi:hypothetical protein
MQQLKKRLHRALFVIQQEPALTLAFVSFCLLAGLDPHALGLFHGLALGTAVLLAVHHTLLDRALRKRRGRD